MHVDKPADHGVQKNDEDCAHGHNEKDDPLTGRVLLCGKLACKSDPVKHDQGRQSHTSIDLGAWEILQRVDDDTICRITSGPWLWEFDAHHGWDLADENVDSRSSHEGREGYQRDQINNPAKPDQADEADDGTTEKGQAGGDVMRIKIREVALELSDNLTSHL